MKTFSNLAIVAGNIGGTILVGESAIALGTIAGPVTATGPAGWVFTGTIIGGVGLTYIVNVGQGTVNNMIEGSTFNEAFFDSRIAVTDSALGDGAQADFDQVINYYWPQSINSAIVSTVLNVVGTEE